MSQPNVVLIVLDTARADDVLATRNNNQVTPALASIAEEGTQFENAFAAAPWTLPSHASLFTGVCPSKHGAHAGNKHLNGRHETIAELFTNAGYETVAVSNNTWISEEFGFGRGFETFYKTWQYVQNETDLGRIAREYEGRSKITALGRALFDGNPIVNLCNTLYGKFGRRRSDDGANRTNEWVESWLNQRTTDDPFFLFLNYLEPHLPYQPPRKYAEPFLPPGISYSEATDIPQQPWEYIANKQEITDVDFEALRALYRGEIAYLDNKLDELTQLFEEAGVWDDTVFVITGDHGENIGDHGLMDHQYCLYETLVHVPLLISGGPFNDGGSSDELVQLTDVLPTLLDVAEIEALDARSNMQGQSFYSANTQSREYVLAEYLAPQPSMTALEERIGSLPTEVRQYDRSLRAIRTDQFKLVRGSDGSRELYDVHSDPNELTDISTSALDRLEQLETQLDEWLVSFHHAETTGDVAISSETKSRLEELGYLQ